jgi:hypothetical protein
MRRRTIEATAVSSAGAAAVYELLADGSTWPEWSPIESFELEQPGSPPPEGVGAIRVFRKGRTVGRDRITATFPNRQFSYANLSGPPVRDYHAEVTSCMTPPGYVSTGEE